MKDNLNNRVHAIKHVYTIEDIKKIAVPIARRYGVEKIAVFGSYARGEAKENSDVDFIISKGAIRGMFGFCGFANDLEEALRLDVDLLTYESLEEDFAYILNEEIVLYES